MQAVDIKVAAVEGNDEDAAQAESAQEEEGVSLPADEFESGVKCGACHEELKKTWDDAEDCWVFQRVVRLDAAGNKASCGSTVVHVGCYQPGGTYSAADTPVGSGLTPKAGGMGGGAVARPHATNLICARAARPITPPSPFPGDKPACHSTALRARMDRVDASKTRHANEKQTGSNGLSQRHWTIEM